jgi:transcriptional regulator with XRE-family HTH domain
VLAVSVSSNRLSLRARRVVRELRRRRDELGWTLEEAAARSHISPATISRTENGEGLRAANVAALLTAYGVATEKIQAFVTMTKQARRSGWWTGIDEAVMSRPYQDLAELEQEAAWKHSFDPQLVPGLLQTERYATAVVAATAQHLSAKQRAEKVEIRLRRQQRLGDLTFGCVVLEEVLRRPMGSPAVMAEQLRRLADASLAGDADLRVVPINVGAHAGLELSGFSLLGGFTPIDTTVLYVETESDDACVEDAEQVDDMKRRYDAILSLALDSVETRELVDKVRTSFA